MKKMLITLTATGVLAIPVGVAVAGNDTVETPEPVPTTVEPRRDRDRIHIDDHAAVGVQNHRQAGQEDGGDDCDGDGAQVRERNQVRVEWETGDGYMERERNQVRVEDAPDGSPEQEPRTNADDPAATPAEDGAELHYQYGRGRGNG